MLQERQTHLGWQKFNLWLALYSNKDAAQRFMTSKQPV
jgi:hypothetical protein